MGILLWRLSENLSIIDQVDLHLTEHAEVIIKAGLLEQMGIDINLITGFTVGLLFINLILFRQWIKLKRWILIPSLMFILTLIISFTYYITLTNSIGNNLDRKQLKTETNE